MNEHQPQEIPTIVYPDPSHKSGKLIRTILFFAVIIAILVTIGSYGYHLKQAKEVPQSPIADTFITDKATILANFSYNGKPVHPNCVFNPDNTNINGINGEYLPQNVTVDSSFNFNLAQCSTPIGGEYDEVTHSYTFPDENNSSTGFVQYDPILQKGNIFVLKVTSSGGGSGVFDDIEVLRKEGDMILNLGYIGAIMSGDRCNGGIDNVAADTHGVLSYEQSLTPFMIVSIGDPTTKVKPYEGLEDSASSCVGLAHYTYMFDSQKAQLQNISIGSDSASYETASSMNTYGKILDQKGWTDQYKYQSCFNKVYNSYIDQDKTSLDQAGITQFAADFMKACVKK